jgi:hypothetical protein
VSADYLSALMKLSCELQESYKSIHFR